MYNICSVSMCLYTDSRIFTGNCAQLGVNVCDCFYIPRMGMRCNGMEWVLKNRRNFSFLLEKNRCLRNIFSEKKIFQNISKSKKKFHSSHTSFLSFFTILSYFHTFMILQQDSDIHSSMNQAIPYCGCWIHDN